MGYVDGIARRIVYDGVGVVVDCVTYGIPVMDGVDFVVRVILLLPLALLMSLIMRLRLWSMWYMYAGAQQYHRNRHTQYQQQPQLPTHQQ